MVRVLLVWRLSSALDATGEEEVPLDSCQHRLDLFQLGLPVRGSHDETVECFRHPDLA